MFEFDEVIERMASVPDGVLIMTDSHYGVYAPQVFLKSLAAPITNVSQRDLDTVLLGPDAVENDLYWEAWTNIETNGVITNNSGKKYMIYQDGDIFLLSVEAWEQATNELERELEEGEDDGEEDIL